jgi:hypothetical protein
MVVVAPTEAPCFVFGIRTSVDGQAFLSSYLAAGEQQHAN